MDDLISRQAAIDEAKDWIDAVYFEETDKRERKAIECVIGSLKGLPSVEPTLYGYKIEHLAYIARVMQKVGISAEDATRTFSDISYAVSMIRDEMRQKIEEVIYDHNTGKI